MPFALAQGMVERRLGTLLTGIVTARLLVACGGVSVAEDGTDAGSGGVGGSGTGGSSVGGTGGSGTGGAGGTGAAGGTGGVGGTGAGGAGVGGAGAMGGSGAVGGTGALGGTGGTGGTGGLPMDTQVVPYGCGGDGAMPLLAHELDLPEPVDHLAVYQHGNPTPLDTEGVRCGGATDRAACESVYATLTPESFPLRPLAIPYLAPALAYAVWTRGDEVAVVVDNDALGALLGPIDTPNEAALALWIGGYSALCQPLYENESGYYTLVTGVQVGCTGGYTSYLLQVTRDGTVSATGLGQQQFMCAGRRPRGLAPSTAPRGDSPVGRYYARVAELESAAVVAFERMLIDYADAGAPLVLLRRIEDAQRDEIRHTRVMSTLASTYGAEAATPRVAPRRTPSLLEMALENVTEGCVRETWGALSARYQSQAAETFTDRQIWSQVADEEARHAELSWDLHAWLMSRLSPAEQREVKEAQRRAWDELVLELAEEPDRDVQRVAGVPSRSTALELARDLAVQLEGWSHAPYAA